MNRPSLWAEVSRDGVKTVLTAYMGFVSAGVSVGTIRPAWAITLLAAYLGRVILDVLK